MSAIQVNSPSRQCVWPVLEEAYTLHHHYLLPFSVSLMVTK